MTPVRTLRPDDGPALRRRGGSRDVKGWAPADNRWVAGFIGAAALAAACIGGLLALAFPH